MTYFSQKGFDTKRPSLKHYEKNTQGNNKRVFSVSPNNVPTLKGSYGKCKGRCLIRVLTLGRGILPVDFRIKWRFSTAQAHTKCSSAFWAHFGLWRFTCKFQ